MGHFSCMHDHVKPMGPHLYMERHHVIVMRLHCMQAGDVTASLVHIAGSDQRLSALVTAALPPTITPAPSSMGMCWVPVLVTRSPAAAEDAPCSPAEMAAGATISLNSR